MIGLGSDNQHIVSNEGLRICFKVIVIKLKSKGKPGKIFILADLAICELELVRPKCLSNGIMQFFSSDETNFLASILLSGGKVPKQKKSHDFSISTAACTIG